MNFRNKNIDLVGKQNLWFSISLALLLIGMVSWAAFGLNLGIDFKGGGQFQYRIPYSQRPQGGNDVKLLDEARSLLETKGLQRVQLQIAGGNTLVINTEASDQSELESQQRRISEALGTRFKGTDAIGQVQELRGLSQQFVGPVIGRELKRAALTGVIVGVLLIALWIYIRYNFAGGGVRYAVAGIFALVHDVLVLVGIFALIGRIDPRIEIDGSFIAALLTVVGYSINDSVVIFDRLRENLRQRRKEPFNKVVNDSLLETMSRSINTGLTVLIMLFVLLMFGGESIYNFVLAMLIGIASGLYSSIFNASMVLTAWNAWDEKKRALAKGTRGAAAATRSSSVASGARTAAIAGGPSTSSAPRRTTFASAAPGTALTNAATPGTATPVSTASPSTNSAVTQILPEVGTTESAEVVTAQLSAESSPTVPTEEVANLSEGGATAEAASETPNAATRAAQATRANTKSRSKRRF